METHSRGLEIAQQIENDRLLIRSAYRKDPLSYISSRTHGWIMSTQSNLVMNVHERFVRVIPCFRGKV